MTTWPLTLPQSFLVDSLQEEPGDNVVTSQNEAGPKKTRQRYTAVEDPISGSMLLTIAQYAIFKTFFQETISHGAVAFNMPDPHGGTMSVKFAGKKYSAKFSYPHWVLNLELMRQP